MEYKKTKTNRMSIYLIAISLSLTLTSCGMPDLEKNFAEKHKITLDFLGSHRSDESIFGGFSGRMYSYKGNSLCNDNYDEVKEGDSDERKIFKKYGFNTKKACVLFDGNIKINKDTKQETGWLYVIADEGRVYFYEYWI